MIPANIGEEGISSPTLPINPDYHFHFCYEGMPEKTCIKPVNTNNMIKLIINSEAV
jgi:hypothetical protein